MQINRAVPHLFTLGNLSCGCISIYLSLAEHNLLYAAVFVFIGMFLDFFDGLAARLLKVPGEFGKQLDSLADMVSFGVAPGALVYVYLSDVLNFWSIHKNWAVLAIMLVLFSAIRLAKFNIDTRQTTSFMGLPTPANAIFWVTLPCALMCGKIGMNQTVSPVWAGDFSAILMLVLIPVFSILMVIDLPLFALKFKNLKWGNNQIRFVFLALAALTLVLCYALLKNVIAAFPIIVVSYLILSVINNAISKTNEV